MCPFLTFEPADKFSKKSGSKVFYLWPTEYRIFQFHEIHNSIMADKETFEVGATELHLNIKS
jgi:hypothetical protein